MGADSWQLRSRREEINLYCTVSDLEGLSDSVERLILALASESVVLDSFSNVLTTDFLTLFDSSISSTLILLTFSNDSIGTSTSIFVSLFHLRS